MVGTKIGEYPIYTEQKVKRSVVGVELVRLLASEGDRIFSTQRARTLAPRVGIKEPYLLEALYHLRRTGWIVPLRRGLDAISSSVPGITPAHEFEIAMALVHPAAISHWSALHHHGLSEQVPRKVFVLTTSGTSVPTVRGAAKAKGQAGFPVGDTRYQFIQVTSKRFFGIEKVWVGEAHVAITDPERTLLDGLSRPHYCGDFAEVLHAFDVRSAHLDVKRIIDYAIRLDAATAKRLGWALEKQGVARAHLEPLHQVPIKGYRRLDPTGPHKGPLDSRWKIQMNLSGKVGP